MARPPKGVKIVERFEGSVAAKERLKTVLETITGETSVLEALERLDVSESRFYQLRDEVLKAGLSSLEPSRRGRPPAPRSEEMEEIERLREEVMELRKELEKERVRTVLAEGLPHVGKDREEKKTVKPASRKERRKKRKEERQRRKGGK
jgi:Mg2+ and Co2+ transporter CorA